jgi:hypothetical protein
MRHVALSSFRNYLRGLRLGSGGIDYVRGDEDNEERKQIPQLAEAAGSPMCARLCVASSHPHISCEIAMELGAQYFFRMNTHSGISSSHSCMLIRM